MDSLKVILLNSSSFAHHRIAYVIEYTAVNRTLNCLLSDEFFTHNVKEET